MLKPLLRILGLFVGLLVLAGATLGVLVWRFSRQDPIEHLYADNCAVCHGANLAGGALGPPLAGGPLAHGDAMPELMVSIRDGYPAKGMPAWDAVLDDDEIKSIALYVAERRDGQRFLEMENDRALEVPTGVVATEEHAFRLEVVADGLAPLPFSIAPLPNGDVLMTEKTGGLVLVRANGERSVVEGTPRGHDHGLELATLPL
ncbi:MAG: c-type cytochrome, partial [Myxococcota bacterium]